MVQIITENMNQFMENFADENLVQTLKKLSNIDKQRT